MSDSLLRVGCRVSVPAKSVKGTVEFIGNTAFAQGKWVGINLDEPKGKNNGTVKDKQYFKCRENHGMFVRQNQLVVLDENDSPVLDLTEETTTKTKTTTKLSRKPPHTLIKPETSSSRLSLASVTSSPSREDLSASTQSLTSQTPSSKRASSFVEKTPTTSKLPKQIPSASKASKVPTAQKQTSARRALSQSKDDVSSVSEQTGFVETLKPQFTPGQVMLSPSQHGQQMLPGPTSSNVTTPAGVSNASMLQQQVESLKEQLKDTTEKYETLKVKRVQDKEKLKDFDKMRLQLEQLLEFKSKIMESQAVLQRELQLAKKEARDAIEAKNLHAEEMSDLTETVEMATLDKEMAEEKAESLQIELQEVRDKLEEVTLDYETLKAELEAGGSGEGGSTGKTSYEFKQLEQQNARLRETLVKMRDLVAHDKHEHQKLQKDLDQKKSEVAELSRTKEKLSSLVETLEEQIADLQEQVDAALGAEELVETLGNDKMTLQEKVSELEEEIADLEALKDTNDQLLEAQKEIDLELREELDMALNTIRETQREKDAALESLNDCQVTIQKFRELVAKLQEQLQDLQGKLDEEAKKPVGIPDMLDFQKIFTETKAHKRAIDLELRQIELSQKDKHVQLLMAFMPDSFLSRGGDHDAILLLLLFPRLLCKCDIILSQINCKYQKVENVVRESVIKEDAVVQYATRCRLGYFLHRCQMILHQFVHGLDTCSADTLHKGGGKFMEIAVQEKVIDSYIESVKRDQLDENVLTEPLEKFVIYIEAMRGILFSAENDRLHQSYCVKDATMALISACESILTDCLSIQVMQADREPAGEVSLILQFVAVSIEHCLVQLKNIRRKVPSDEPDLNISPELLSNLIGVSQGIAKLVKAVHEVSKKTRQHILLEGVESGKGLESAKLGEIFQSSVDKNLESDDIAGVDSVKKEMTDIVKVIAEFNVMVEETDYELLNPSSSKLPEKPIVTRATAIKKELDETKILAKKLESKEMDIRELKLALKTKQEELSEMCIRKDLVEKKLFNINKDHDSEIAKIKSELEKVLEEARKKEKDFESGMDHLSSDIEELEKERDKLKEMLKIQSKKQPGDVPVKIDASASKINNHAKSPWTSSDGDALQNELNQLKTSLKHMSLAYFKLQNEVNRKNLADLPKVPLFEGFTDLNKHSKKVLNELWKEGQELQKNVLNNLVFEIADFSKVKRGDKIDPKLFFAKQFHRKNEIQEKINNFSMRVNKAIVRMTNGGHIETPLALFPTPEVKKALFETKPLTVGELTIPSNQKEPKIVPLIVDLHSLRAIQDKISALV